MGSNLIRDIRKRWCHGFWAKQLNVAESQAGLVSNQQIRRQWRGYAQSHLTKIRASSKSSHPLYTITTRPLSSSGSGSGSGSASASKIGFVGWYLANLQSRPLLTKAISSSLIFAAADFTSQRITSPASGSFDLIRTLRMAAYGLIILGPSQHLWFNFVSKLLPKRDLVSTLKKIFMGQALYGPCVTSVFFSYNASLQGESGEEIVARLKRDLLPTLVNGLMYWPICDFVTFKFVPVRLQPLMNSSCAYLWTIYLTYMASLKR
ncbi:Mpv17/PMP [Parasponia andersonii]|uniref:Mpv17/PMP n=1 Tax=Parasponia andersonii TaxID=3476 RepID=A0A2P5BZM8_PARAD|nr:Mpv17/PMP [Parasponia andersonii]